MISSSRTDVTESGFAEIRKDHRGGVVVVYSRNYR